MSLEAGSIAMDSGPTFEPNPDFFANHTTGTVTDGMQQQVQPDEMLSGHLFSPRESMILSNVDAGYMVPPVPSNQRRFSIISRGSQGGFQDMGLPDAKDPGCFGRFWNIRNATIAVNTGILAIAILTLTLVSFLLSSASTTQALTANSIAGADRIVGSLEDAFLAIEANGQRLSNGCALGLYQNVTNNLMLKVLYEDISISSSEVQAIYLAIFNEDPLIPNFDIVQRTFDESQQEFVYDGGFKGIADTNLTIWSLNTDTCTLSDTSCILPDFSNPITTSPYDPTGRPWYLSAVAANRTIWTTLYLFPNDAFGITMALPSFGNNIMGAVIGNDLEINALSFFLQSILTGLIADNSHIRLYLISKNATDFGPLPCSQPGILISTNIPALTPDLLDANKCPIIPQDCPDEIISSSATFVRQTCGPFADIITDPSGPCFSLSYSKYLVQLRDFRSTHGDIDWLVVLVVPKDVYLGSLQRLYVIIVPVVAVCLFVVSIILGALLTLYITRPLKRLTKQLLTVANLEFEQVPSGKPMNGKSDRLQLAEVAKLEGAMNVMTTGLKSFSKYVPRDLVRLLVKMKREAVLGVDERILTIFFSDIADFTTISEELEPDDLVTLMGEYLQEMSTIVTRNHGIVDKFIGDAVMAFWNAPSDLPNHALIACEVALQSQERLRELQAKWTNQHYPLVKVRIGLHTGSALVGNLGAPDRMNFTCIGDSVNLASRLEGLNKLFGSNIMLSEVTFMAVEHVFVCRLLGLIAVKGKNVPVKVYELQERRETATQEKLEEVETYNQAMMSYLNREFAVCLRLLEEYMEKHPDDLAAKMHIEFCHKYMLQPPDDSWTGVLKLTEK